MFSVKVILHKLSITSSDQHDLGLISGIELIRICSEVLVHCIPDRCSDYTLFSVLLQLLRQVHNKYCNKNVYTNLLRQMNDNFI